MTGPLSPGLVGQILKGYALPWHGTHGVTHWARVLENARELARRTGADLHVVELFAVFHDSRRMNEARDRGHGWRGAQLAHEMRGTAFDLDEGHMALLDYACTEHTHGLTTGDISVQVCWDADRLDLLRVGIRPDPRLLCTDAAKDPQMIQWANERALVRYSPALLTEEWGLDGRGP